MNLPSYTEDLNSEKKTHQLRRVELGKVKLDAVHPVSVSPEVRGEALVLQLGDLRLYLIQESLPL